MRVASSGIIKLEEIQKAFAENAGAFLLPGGAVNAI